MMSRRLVCFSVMLVLFITGINKEAWAVPPLVAGDVPTAEKNHIELYSGIKYQKVKSIERQVPFTELVYGISDKHEVTFEVPYLSLQDHKGFGDVVVGTKYQFIPESNQYPGLAGSFEVKLDTASQTKGLGTGATDYDIRIRSQKMWKWFTGILNFGYTFVGEPEENGMRQERRDVLFLAFAQEYRISPKLRLLSEIYWKNSEELHTPYRLAGDVGVKYELMPHLAIHAAIGKSLREGDIGGPELRMYAGIKVEFPLGKE